MEGCAGLLAWVLGFEKEGNKKRLYSGAVRVSSQNDYTRNLLTKSPLFSFLSIKSP